MPLNKTLFLQEQHILRVLINHVLEHVDDVVKTMEEVWRISKPGAIIK